MINYKKWTWALVLFALWNTVSPSFVDYNVVYRAYSGQTDWYMVLWAVWGFMSFVSLILYILDFKKRESSNLGAEGDITSNPKSQSLKSMFLRAGLFMVESFLALFVLGLISHFGKLTLTLWALFMSPIVPAILYLVSYFVFLNLDFPKPLRVMTFIAIFIIVPFASLEISTSLYYLFRP